MSTGDRFNGGWLEENFSGADSKKRMEWYQYLQRVFWRAGHYRGLTLLEQATNSLQVMPQDQPALRKLQTKIESRKQMAGTVMNNPNFRDRTAYEATLMLIKQSYPQASAFLKSRTPANFDHYTASDDMNAIVLTFGIIHFDILYDRPKIPLWEYFWKLRLVEKIEVLKYASELRESRNLSALPKIQSPAFRQAVRARAMLIMKLDSLENLLRVPEIHNAWVEKCMLKGYAAVLRGDYCGAIAHFSDGLKNHNHIGAKADLNAHIASWQPKCNKLESTRTFAAFCQTGSGTEFPIGEAAMHQSNAKAIRDNELMAWTAMRVGDCTVAMQALTQLKQLVSQTILASNPIVSSRISYMEQNLTQCQRRNNNTFGNPAGQQVLQALRSGQSSQAIQMARGSGDKRLLMAALLHRFPRAIYTPCMGGSVVGDTDLPILELVEQIGNGQVLPFCLTNDEQCTFNQLRAFYITGSYADVKRLAKQLPRSSTFCRPTVQMLGCTELCTAGTDMVRMRKAVKHFDQLLESGQSSPAVNVAKQLAEAKLRPSIATLAPVDFVDQQLGKTTSPEVTDMQVNLRSEIPPPSISASPLHMGSCTQKGACNKCNMPSPCPCMQPCAQAAAIPAPPAQVAPNAQATNATAPTGASTPAANATPTPASTSSKPCSCSGSGPTGVPVNQATGKPWTPQELQKKIDDDKKKLMDDALPLVEPVVQQKLADICNKQKQNLDKALDILKDAFKCDECTEAQRKTAEAEAMALATGAKPIEKAASKNPKQATQKPAGNVPKPVDKTPAPKF
jgi:hypothetical protein